MTFITDTSPVRIAIPATVRKIFDGIAGFFISLTEAQSRAAEMNRLNDMSDRQLADLGIEREDIARHVFRDLYYVL